MIKEMTNMILSSQKMPNNENELFELICNETQCLTNSFDLRMLDQGLLVAFSIRADKVLQSWKQLPIKNQTEFQRLNKLHSLIYEILVYHKFLVRVHPKNDCILRYRSDMASFAYANLIALHFS